MSLLVSAIRTASRNLMIESPYLRLNIGRLPDNLRLRWVPVAGAA